MEDDDILVSGSEPSKLSATPSFSEISTIDADEDALDADKLLLNQDSAQEIARKLAEQSSILEEPTQKKQLRDFQNLKSMDKLVIHDPKVPWFAMRDCLLLTLQSRMILKEMILFKLKEERIRLGELSVSEIQNLLKGQKEDQENDLIAGNLMTLSF
jgi:hypothetical protein